MVVPVGKVTLKKQSKRTNEGGWTNARHHGNRQELFSFVVSHDPPLAHQPNSLLYLGRWQRSKEKMCVHEQRSPAAGHQQRRHHDHQSRGTKEGKRIRRHIFVLLLMMVLAFFLDLASRDDIVQFDNRPNTNGLSHLLHHRLF